MLSDEQIEAERAALAPLVGPTHAGWYAEACKLEYDDEARVVLWACRLRESVRVHARDLGSLAAAARQLLSACSRLDEQGGQRVRDAMQAVEKALWWQEPQSSPLPVTQAAQTSETDQHAIACAECIKDIRDP